MVDSVRAVRLTPDKPDLDVGDELKCSASGNPSPRLTFSPETVEVNGKGQDGGVTWITTVVPAEWKGQQHTVNCTAVNGLKDQAHEVTASTTFNVIASAKVLGR